MKKIKILTLSFIHDENNILLALKKRGFGAGRYNGYGGKVEEGETIEEAAIRETKEEINIDIKQLEKRGILTFDSAQFKTLMQVHVFKIIDFKGEPKETEEMKPEWFAKEKIPFKQMWPDDEFWLPEFLKGKKFIGKFNFGENDKILSHELNEVETLE